MAAFLIPLIMAAAQAASDSEKESRESKLQSEITRYSPWTKMTGKEPTRANPVGTMMQGFGAGMANQQAEANAEQTKQLNEKYGNLLDAQSGFYAGRKLGSLGGANPMDDGEKMNYWDMMRRGY